MNVFIWEHKVKKHKKQQQQKNNALVLTVSFQDYLGKPLSMSVKTECLWQHNHSSSKRSERFVRFEPNVRSERVRYFSERETNVQALKRLINLIAVK